MNDNSNLTLLAVGDIAPLRENPVSIFDGIRETFQKADITFCQLEINLTKRGTQLPQARLAMRADPTTARAIKEAGFQVVSFASNHCMDWGREAFFDTINTLREQNINVLGVGNNISEARKPVMIEKDGVKIAFLAYNTILPYGYWAEADRPGCVPLRGLTLYEQIEHDQPGTPCRIHSYPHRGDLREMISDVKKAKAQAEVVVVSMHWGIHFIPAVIADYQREMAHVAIDSGADLILGHHAHILKGIEVYKGKVIFYSLCNFALDLSPTKEMLESKKHQEIMVLNPKWQPDPEYPTYYMPPDSRKTIVVKCTISGRKIKQVSYLPTYIKKNSQPEILKSEDKRFSEVTEYMKEISLDQGLETKFMVERDEVIIDNE
jgi:poly-gamma-glutamate capsule biosynthesis protein CapA/YwtB (metallophosphatase superfamily)